MAYDEIVAGGMVTMGLSFIYAGVRFWRDNARQEAENKATRALALNTAKELSLHRHECNEKNVRIGVMGQRISDLKETVDKFDGKLDRILERVD